MTPPEPPGKNLADVPVLFSIYPEHPDFRIALNSGLTTLALSPPGEGISGLGAIIQPSGQTLHDMLLKDRAFLKIHVYVNTAFWNLLKGALDEAQNQLKKSKEKDQDEKSRNKESQEKSKDKKIKERTEIFMGVLEGKLPLVAECPDPDSVAHLISLVSHYPKMKLIIRGGPYTHKAGHILKEKGIPVILEPRIHIKGTFANPYQEIVNTVLKYQGLGIKMAFQASGNIEDQKHLLHYLNQLHELGVNKDVLLEGITIIPAQFLGIDSQTGSLEKSKRADVLILRGNPLENVPLIDKVILGGKEVGP
jgi:hypothetical protein